MKNLKITGIYGFLLQFILSIVTVVFVVKLNVLPAFYIIFIVFILLFLLFISGVFVIARSKPRVAIGTVFSFLTTILLGVVTFVYLLPTINTLEKITLGADTYISTYYVVVKKDDVATKPEDIKDYQIGVEKSHDFDAMEKALNKIAKEYNHTLNVTAYDNYISMWEAFMNRSETGAILMETNYYGIYKDSYEEDGDNISNHVKIIGHYDVEMHNEKDEESQKDKKDLTAQPFAVYISGIDLEGNINQKSRSDVNIVMAVNPVTHKIALVTVPRDSYVKFPGVTGDSYDKLTHAGIYGKNDCSVSIATLEQNVYTGIHIDYWMRVNFTSLKKIVDVLGGIEAYSAYSYTSTFSGTDYYFEKGMNYMDGEKALVFCRERKTLKGGEEQRGRNQLEVIKGIFNKAISPSIITNYNSLLEEIDDCILTNMPQEAMTELIKMQIDDGSAWSFETASVAVEYDYDYCYSMPGNKYCIGRMDEESRQAATDLIKSTLKAK